MLDWKRCCSYLAAAAVAVSLGGCGSGPGTCPVGQTGTPPNCIAVLCPAGQVGTPPNCTTPCTQTVVESGSGPAKSKTLYYFDFSVPDSGRLDITVDWTSPSSTVGVFVVPANTCTVDEFNARSCNFLVRSEFSTVKPRKISTPNFAAGNYRWLIGVSSSNDESISYQFVLSKGSCPALTVGAPPSVSARGGEAFTALTRAEAH
jgi:hypothetical protein